MSNSTIAKILDNALANYIDKKITRKELISAVEENGRALENMPYHLIKDIDAIEYQLTVCQFADADDFLPDEEKAIIFLKQWLTKIPRDE